MLVEVNSGFLYQVSPNIAAVLRKAHYIVFSVDICTTLTVTTGTSHAKGYLITQVHEQMYNTGLQQHLLRLKEDPNIIWKRQAD